MGSPARRLLNPITRCWDNPHNRYAGTDDGRGTGQQLDAERLTLMSAQKLVRKDGRRVVISWCRRTRAATLWQRMRGFLELCEVKSGQDSRAIQKGI